MILMQTTEMMFTWSHCYNSCHADLFGHDKHIRSPYRSEVSWIIIAYIGFSLSVYKIQK